MYKYGYLNDKIIQTDKPQLFLDDIGILRGFSSFDFLRIYNSHPFEIKDHYLRFVKSSKILGLKVPISQKQLEQILKTLLSKNKIKDAHVRIVLTGGKTVGGILPSKPNLFILLETLKDLPPTLFKKGGKLITFDHQRLFAEAKTTNYLQAVVLQREKNKFGAIEILYINRGKVLEPTTSNIFLVNKNTIITPKENILEGVTRKTVIKLAKKAGYGVVEKNILESELYKADEVFITATNKKVLPIVQINNKKIGNGKVGEVSKELNNLFGEYIKKECY